MSTTYPTSKKTFRDVVDNEDDVLAQDHNDVADTVEAIQDEIGYGKTDSDPDSVQYRVTNHVHDGTVGNGGTISLNDLSDKTSTKLSDMPSSLSGQTGKVLKVNSGETGYELSSIAIKNYLSGFCLEYSSSTALIIQSGTVDINGTLLTSVNNTSLNPKTSSNYIELTVPTSSWVNVYLYNNSGNVGYKLSVNNPNKADTSGNTDGTQLYYTADSITFYRFIGSIYLDSSSNLLEFVQIGKYFEIINKLSIFSSNTSNTYAGTYAVSLPTNVRMINVEVMTYASGAGSSVLAKVKGNLMSDNYYRMSGGINYAGTAYSISHEVFNQETFTCKIGTDKLVYVYIVISAGGVQIKALGFWQDI